MPPSMKDWEWKRLAASPDRYATSNLEGPPPMESVVVYQGFLRKPTYGFQMAVWDTPNTNHWLRKKPKGQQNHILLSWDYPLSRNCESSGPQDEDKFCWAANWEGHVNPFPYDKLMNNSHFITISQWFPLQPSYLQCQFHSSPPAIPLTAGGVVLGTNAAHNSWRFPPCNSKPKP